MKNNKAVKKRAAIPTTQKSLTIAEIRNDSVVMRDGTLRAVLMVSSINFALKNEDEQQAIDQPQKLAVEVLLVQGAGTQPFTQFPVRRM